MTHRFVLRVYYEDTDLAGIVYYANYLRFIERARTEWVRAIGIDQTALRSGQGIVFAVRRIEADFLAPARFDDLLEVRTALAAATGARIVLAQDIWRGGERLFASAVTLVALAGSRPVRLPDDLRRRLAGPGGSDLHRDEDLGAGRAGEGG
ncbi:MAG: tol-pal system-associated acyl-CoA thioesterase [Rhodobacteraceae bacterium]|nr:tol-pal system-associated acyl-CoA thioesterase [Paracoccaceae bacterium]